MFNYNNMTDFEIIRKFHKFVKKVNKSKEYMSANLNKQEKLKVERLLVKRLKMTEKQAEWMLNGTYRKHPVRQSLLILEGLDKEVEYSFFASFVHRIRCYSWGFLLFFCIGVFIGLLFNIYLILKKGDIFDGLIVINLFWIPLNIIGILTILLQYKNLFLRKLSKLKNDDKVKIEGIPLKLSIHHRIEYRRSPEYSRELLFIEFYFFKNNKKLKIIYALRPFVYLYRKDSSIRKQIKTIKDKLMKKSYIIYYFAESRFISESSIDVESLITNSKKNKTVN